MYKLVFQRWNFGLAFAVGTLWLLIVMVFALLSAVCNPEPMGMTQAVLTWSISPGARTTAEDGGLRSGPLISYALDFHEYRDPAVSCRLDGSRPRLDVRTGVSCAACLVATASDLDAVRLCDIAGHAAIFR